VSAMTGHASHDSSHSVHEDHGGHDHHHFTEAEWTELAAATELEGEVLIGFVTATIDRIRSMMPAGRGHIIDVGSGPAVAACEFAVAFPHARVVAFDSSSGMLARAAQRIERLDVGSRVSTRLGDVPGGFDGLGVGVADLVWASMSLHHVGDEVAALAAMRDLLVPGGVLAIAEMAGPTRVLPDDLAVGKRGLDQRIEQAHAAWFAGMRAALPESTDSQDLAAMIRAAGFSIVDDRVETLRVDPPLTGESRAFAVNLVEGFRRHADEALSSEDVAVLDVLLDPTDPRSVHLRDDVFIDASRRIVLARPR
jgi:ubiquinone/menaquinone biosynthesis C-methylase UbiE